MTSLVDSLTYIPQLFIEIGEMTRQKNDKILISAYLNQLDTEYKALCFESASMAIADQELTSSKSITEWEAFYEINKEKYCFHMQIGLGWALAKTDNSPLDFFPSKDFSFLQVLADGMGYYFALYKPRKTLLNFEFPEILPPELQNGFNQGIGRRLWYNCLTDLDMLKNAANIFPENRLSYIWKGVGIACAYVGKYDSCLLKNLLSISDLYSIEVRKGLTVGTISRTRAKEITDNELELIKIYCTDEVSH